MTTLVGTQILSAPVLSCLKLMEVVTVRGYLDLKFNRNLGLKNIYKKIFNRKLEAKIFKRKLGLKNSLKNRQWRNGLNVRVKGK